MSSPSIQNLGLEHFYAAFGLGCSRNLRTSSAYALRISEHTISEDCSVSMDIATQLQPLQHGIPCETQAKKRAKTSTQDMVIQPDVDKEEDSSPNGSDSEASSKQPARSMLRTLTLILKNSKTITTLPCGDTRLS